MKKLLLLKILYSIIGLLLLYSVLGFWVLPKILTSQLPSLAKEELNRDLQFDDLNFNPFSMELDITGFRVKKIGVNSFFNFQHFYINIAVLRSIADLTFTIDEIQLNQPNVFVIRDKHGVFNFNDVLERLASKDKDGPKKQEDASTDPFPVTILQMAISDGKLSWIDDFYSHAQKEDIYPINLKIDNFTTVPQKQSQLDIIISTASGGRLEWQGEIELFPFSSSGHIKLVEIDFHRIWELFLQDHVKFDLTKGTEIFEADYELKNATEGMQLLVNNAHFHIQNFQLTEKDSVDPLITIPDFKISGIAVNLLRKTVGINSISATDAHFKTWLNTDGSVNYQSLFSSSTNDTAPSQQSNTEDTNKEESWQVNVKQLALNNFSLDFMDKSLSKPAKLNITSFNFSSHNLNINPRTSIPFNLDLTLNDKGKLNIEGSTVLEPLEAKVQVNASNIGIKEFQPYIASAVKLDIISGLFNIKTNVTMAQLEGKPLAIGIMGDSSISNLVTRDQITNKDFLKWKQLSLENIDINLAKNSFLIDKIKLEEPYVKFLIKKDKSTNINDIVVKSTKKSDDNAVIKAENSKQPKTTFKINKVEFLKGSTNFSDLSLILPFSAHIKQLSGSVKDISSTQNTVTKIAMAGLVAGISPVNIKGNINPDKGNSELTLDFNSMPLPLATPYMAEFAGRKVEKGNMSLALSYKIKNNKLTSSNKLLIDQLVLGDEVEHPNAVSLPLDLAIALLKDGDGKIALDVPIKGSLDDPQFSVSGVIVDALVNVITKIISSPFNTIASLIGSDEDISKISFSAGKVILTESQRTKLDGLSTALMERPLLNLEIKGIAFSEQDWPLLQAEALDKQLLQIKADQLNRENDKKILAEHVTLTAKEYQNLLADLFIQKYPQLADRSLFGKPRLLDPAMGDFYTIAKRKLAAAIPPDLLRLQQLAKQRAQAIAKYLVDKGIPVGKIFLLNVNVESKSADATLASTLTLMVN